MKFIFVRNAQTCKLRQGLFTEMIECLMTSKYAHPVAGSKGDHSCITAADCHTVVNAPTALQSPEAEQRNQRASPDIPCYACDCYIIERNAHTVLPYDVQDG